MSRLPSAGMRIQRPLFHSTKLGRRRVALYQTKEDEEEGHDTHRRVRANLQKCAPTLND
jgi:hypothetical protein